LKLIFCIQKNPPCEIGVMKEGILPEESVSTLEQANAAPEGHAPPGVPASGRLPE
jgi:hypothetical protein